MMQAFTPAFLLYFFFINGFRNVIAQGFCSKYTCEKNQDFSPSLILKCTSDRPEIISNRSSNFECSADLHLLDLKLGITICSRTAPSYSMDVVPDPTASRELQRLYRYLQAVVSQTANTNALCYPRNILPTRRPLSTTPEPNTPKTAAAHQVARSVLIGAVIGAFLGGALLTAIILVSIYFCCVSRKKDKSRRFTINPRINEAYQRDPNDNLDSSPTDLRQKDWSREHRGRMDRLNGMINAFTLENVVDPYATIEDNVRPARPERRAPPRPTPEEISAMYSTVEKTKKTRAPNGSVARESPKSTTSNEIYINGRNTNAGGKTESESVAGSSEIVPPENSLRLYHITEKSDES